MDSNTKIEHNIKMREVDWAHTLVGWFAATLLLISAELAGQIIQGNVPLIIIDCAVVAANIACLLFWRSCARRERRLRALDDLVNDVLADAVIAGYRRVHQEEARQRKKKAVK